MVIKNSFLTLKKESGDVPFMREPYFMNRKKQKSTTHPSHNLQFMQTGTPYACRDFPDKNHTKFFIKGMSTLFFGKNHAGNLSAGMTVEAAIVLPLFLFFFLNLLGIIEIYRLHSTLLAALRETGRELSVYAYAYKAVTREEEDEGLEALLENIAFSYLYVKGRVEDLAGEKYLETSPLSDGKEGIWYVNSSILQQGDIIDLVASYQVSPFVGIVGFSPARFYCRYYGRAWTGYEVTPEEAGSQNGEEYVYVAENAEVYHLNRECTHIRLSISECGAAELETLRNESGGRYTPCELCVTYLGDRFYVGRSGDRYHQDLNCSGLKRTITVMLRSEAEMQYRMCSRCGG